MNRDFVEMSSALCDAGAEYLIVGAPLHELSKDDLSTPDVVFQIGLPPNRIDLMTSISGVEFEAAWAGRVSHSYLSTYELA